MKKKFLIIILSLIVLLVAFGVNNYYKQVSEAGLELYVPSDDTVASVENYYKEVYGEDFIEIVGKLTYKGDFLYGVNIKGYPQIEQYRLDSEGTMEWIATYFSGVEDYVVIGDNTGEETVIIIAAFVPLHKIVFYDNANNTYEYVIPDESKGLYMYENDAISEETNYYVYDVENNLISDEIGIEFMGNWQSVSYSEFVFVANARSIIDMQGSTTDIINEDGTLSASYEYSDFM